MLKITMQFFGGRGNSSTSSANNSAMSMASVQARIDELEQQEAKLVSSIHDMQKSIEQMPLNSSERRSAVAEANKVEDQRVKVSSELIEYKKKRQDLGGPVWWQS